VDAQSALEPRGANLERAKAPLSVVRLALTNFRSYSAAQLQTHGAPIVLAGPNGAGKTNLLDAISLLSPGRGLRGAKLSDHVRQGPNAASGALWAVAATVSRAGEDYEIGTGLVAGINGGERRQVRLNGVAAQGSIELGEIVQMLWLTPAMDRLFIEGASGRRRFLDRLVLGFDADHARQSMRYEKAMRERARLLKFGPRDPAWLDGLEAEMADAGLTVVQARALAVTRLNLALAERGSAGAFPAAELAIVNEPGNLLDEGQTPERLREAWRDSRVRDAQAGRTTVGPHLSDLVVRHTAKRADARQCSTGEQKALLISIILADAWELSRLRGGISPLLLLDEIAAHLDLHRRTALFEEILALGAQAWMTGTDLSLFHPIGSRAEIFHVAEGAFLRQE
jgi:DNA replication and repair protein RecF